MIKRETTLNARKCQVSIVRVFKPIQHKACDNLPNFPFINAQIPQVIYEPTSAIKK